MNLLGDRWSWWPRSAATLGLLIAAALVAMLGVTVVDAIQSEHVAVSSLATARQLTARRIDRLNRQIDLLARQNATAARQRGELRTEIVALTAQLRQLGVRPVVATGAQSPAGSTGTARPRTAPSHAPTVAPTRSPQPAAPPSVKPTPTPSPTRTPTPSPSPTCRVQVVVCLR